MSKKYSGKHVTQSLSSSRQAFQQIEEDTAAMSVVAKNQKIKNNA